MKERNTWSTARIPEPLYEQIRSLIEKPDSGYISISSFIAEAIRIHLNEIRKIRAICEKSNIYD